MSLLRRMKSEESSKPSRESRKDDSIALRKALDEKSSFDKRLEEIRLIWQQNQWLYIFVGFLGGLIAFPTLNLISKDIQAFLTTMVPEGVSIAITVFFIDAINRRREQMRRIEELKDELIRKVASTSNETAKSALDELSRLGWIHGDNGLLQGTDLYRANWFQARLSAANLRGAILARANLKGAWMYGANLEGANLWEAKFDENTTLPDGTKWTADSDLSKFDVLLERPDWVSL